MLKWLKFGWLWLVHPVSIIGVFLCPIWYGHWVDGHNKISCEVCEKSGEDVTFLSMATLHWLDFD